MPRFASIPYLLNPSSDITMVNSTMALLPGIIQTDQAICGTLHLRAKLNSGSASQKIDIYGVYSIDGTTFDTANVANNPLLGTINLINGTHTYENYTLRLDGMVVAGYAMKIAIVPGSASAGMIEGVSAKVLIRTPK